MKSNGSKHLKQSKGFSLIELMIALVVLGFAVAAGFSALRSGLDRLTRLRDAADRDGDAAIALALLAKDARAAMLDDARPTLFVGYHDDATGKDRLQLSLADADVEYFVAADRVLRRRTGARTVKLCTNVDRFKFNFFDGISWKSEWGWDDERHRPYAGIRGLPVALRVTLDDTTVTMPIMTALLNARP